MSVHVSIFVCLSAKKTSFKIKWLHISKNVSIKSCHILKRIKVTILCLDFFGSDLSKLDQTWSNWISHQSKNVTIKSCHIIVAKFIHIPVWLGKWRSNGSCIRCYAGMKNTLCLLLFLRQIELLRITDLWKK